MMPSFNYTCEDYLALKQAWSIAIYEGCRKVNCCRLEVMPQVIAVGGSWIVPQVRCCLVAVSLVATATVKLFGFLGA